MIEAGISGANSLHRPDFGGSKFPGFCGLLFAAAVAR
jgi:hypothetical protein